MLDQLAGNRADRVLVSHAIAASHAPLPRLYAVLTFSGKSNPRKSGTRPTCLPLEAQVILALTVVAAKNNVTDEIVTTSMHELTCGHYSSPARSVLLCAACIPAI